MIDKQIFISYCEPERNCIMEAVRKEETCMKEYISYCGLNCETCNARLATIFNDDALSTGHDQLYRLPDTGSKNTLL